MNCRITKDEGRRTKDVFSSLISHLSSLVTQIFRILVAWCLCVLVSLDAYALNLDKAKNYFLSGDYNSAISEGERLLASNSGAANSDELYHILALSYMKDGNYLRASDIFEIILKEFKQSSFRDEATLGLGDTFFLRGEYDKAKAYYQELININGRGKLVPAAYYRLSQCAFKQGNPAEGKEYLNKLKEGSPLNPELLLNRDLCFLPDSSDFYYTVQVGAFSSPENARRLTDKLVQNGYPAYLEEVASPGKPSYRVRVGKFKLRKEAAQWNDKLTQEGYPTRICP